MVRCWRRCGRLASRAERARPRQALPHRFSQQADLAQISVRGGNTGWDTLGNASGLGMWIYGDASGDRIHVNERHNGGGSVATAPQTIDWLGWKYVEPFSAAPGERITVNVGAHLALGRQ